MGQVEGEGVVPGEAGVEPDDLVGDLSLAELGRSLERQTEVAALAHLQVVDQPIELIALKAIEVADVEDQPERVAVAVEGIEGQTELVVAETANEKAPAAMAG